jgi:hypothetical protein
VGTVLPDSSAKVRDSLPTSVTPDDTGKNTFMLGKVHALLQIQKQIILSLNDHRVHFRARALNKM